MKPEAIVDYWLGGSVRGPEAADGERERWYRGGPALDAEIGARFTDRVEQAVAGQLGRWSDTAAGSLAIVILLDQFTRTIYRGTRAAYCGDARAFDVSEQAIARELDRELPVTGRVFLYHPHHHSESVARQDRGIELLREMKSGAEPRWHPYIERCIEGFSRHRDVVARFGRFPHRNAALGRDSTPEETAYLEGGAERYGQ